MAGADDPASPGAMRKRLFTSAGIHWYLGEAGRGASVLLLHGTGSSMHSWALLAPLLAQRFSVTMVDLPGHGQTSMPPRSGLAIEGMSAAIGALVDDLAIRPELVIGHSAGAAVLVQMCLEGRVAPRAVISLNGALLPFSNGAQRLFGPVAKLLAFAPLVPSLVSRRMANVESVTRLVGQLGSTLPDAQIDGYVRLLKSRRHIAAALGMMANWDLDAFSRRLDALQVPLELVACDNDGAVPAAQADQLARRLPVARVHRLAGLGHLGHEEDPQTVFTLVEGLARQAGIAG